MKTAARVTCLPVCSPYFSLRLLLTSLPLVANKVPSSWIPLDPGKLRLQVQIQQQQSTVDSVGQPILNWQTIQSVWASVRMLTQQEKMQNDQLASDVTHIVQMRYAAGVSAGMRVLSGTHTYTIQAVDDQEQRGIVLNLLCLEVTAVS
jgi:SPP1 family predicted phage head-tail adaptor